MSEKEGHWLDGVVEIMEADSSDLKQLAKVVGANPETFYAETDLAGVDLSGQNLGEMALSLVTTKSRIGEAILSRIVSMRRERRMANERDIRLLLSQISSMKAQNDRFSAIVLVSFIWPKFSEYIKSEYKEKTKISRNALAVYFDHYSLRNATRESVDNVIICDAVAKSLRSIYHLNRGVFLCSIVRDLGYIPQMKHVIGKYTSATWTMAPYQSTIAYYLNLWETGHQSE